jgi:hypothetical protein
VCDGLSEQVYLQTSAITDRDVSSDPGQVLGSPSQSLSLDTVSYFSFVTFDPQTEVSGARYTPEASSATPPSTTDSSSDTSLDRTHLGPPNFDPYLQTHEQAAASSISKSKICEVCRGVFDCSLQLW